VIRRRELFTLLGGAAVLTPSFVHAQEGRIYRLGVLNTLGRQEPPFAPFFDELRQLGFVEGGNLIVDARGFAANFPVLIYPGDPGGSEQDLHWPPRRSLSRLLAPPGKRPF
jgi:hypothetical protein